jgi:hypothetical protein
MPVISSREDRRTLAGQLIDGDRAAVAAGFPAMANPSAAELQSALASADKEAGEVVPVTRELQDVLEKIRAARPRAIELVEEVLAELRHSTRKLEEGTARDILRSYGVTFESLPGETPEPTPAPAPATSTTITTSAAPTPATPA